MGRPEATVEDRLVEGALARGGRAAKVVDLGRRGAPDRQLFMPGRLRAPRSIWIETKAKGGVLKSWQKRYHEELRRCGYDVLTLWTVEQVDEFWKIYDQGIYG